MCLKYEIFGGLEIDPRSGYGITDLVRLFLIISKGPAGRTVIMRELGVGEATAKTIIKFLSGKGLIEQGTRGICPSKKGLDVFSICSSFSDMKEIHIPEFSDKPAVALVVRGAAGSVRSGIEQRDEGVKFGAKIVTLVKKSGGLSLAGIHDYQLPYKNVIDGVLDTKENDTVIISSADSKPDAERGAIAAGLKTISERHHP